METLRRTLFGTRWLLVAGAILAAVTVISISIQHRTIATVIDAGFDLQIQAEADMVAELVQRLGPAERVDLSRTRLGRDRRLTLIAADGHVIADSQADVATLDDHGKRPEVIAARAHGSGLEHRRSATLNHELVYAARRLDDGTVVRVSAPIEVQHGRIHEAWWPMAVASAAVIVTAGILVTLQLWRDRFRFGQLIGVSRAYMAGEYSRRSALVGDDALSRLGRELNRLGENLQASRAELARQRELLDTALGTLGEGVACVDRLGRVVYANPAYRQFAAGGAEVVNLPYFQHLPDAGVAAQLDRLRQGQAVEAAGVLCEHRRRHLRIAVAPAGEVAVLIIHDLTEVRRLENSRRDFVASVSHELKTPLTAIVGFADTILQEGVVEDDPAQVRAFVSRISAHAQRLTTLVTDVLTLSRLEQGSWEVKPVAIDLPRLARTILDEHNEHARSRDVRLACTGPEALELVTDPELVRQMVGNLVSNAIRYNRPQGRVEVAISDLDGRIRIAISDTGIGIPPEHRERIFERFYRIDAHRSRQTGGTGLGLAIVKQLAEVLGGTVAVESGPEGSRFTVELPRAWAGLS